MTAMSVLVSIIIPVYNRQHLIEETLVSIQQQTYTTWECILVDDGSNDDTVEVVSAFAKADTRFKIYKRPTAKKKGANACRNYGFEKSTGTYINWFDSDDLMLPTFLEKKVKTLTKESYDFVFSSSYNFYPDMREEPIFEVDATKPITAFNFVTQQIAWITMDFMATRASLEGLVFNEALQSGQEFNLITRYLCTTTHGVAIYEKLALRRVHHSSIQSKVTKNKETNAIAYLKNVVFNKYNLLVDIQEYPEESVKEYLANSLIFFSFELAKTKASIPNVTKILQNVYLVKGLRSSFYLIMAITVTKVFGKGYLFMKKAKE